MSRIFVLAAVALTITGCGRQESPNPNLETPLPQEDTSAPAEDPAMIETCAAKDLQYLVGQPETVLETMRFGTVVRIERPGDVITMEYSAERTRIIIGEDKRIARVICG
jgi:hypothetical protein